MRRTAQTLQLAPGEHYFAQGQLQLQGNATLTGSDVVLIFDKHDRTFEFAGQLDHRPLGAAAAALSAGLRDRHDAGQHQRLHHPPQQAKGVLEGAVYVPDATLNVTGTSNNVADQSAWTVVVAKSLQLQGQPETR